jgi:hypothetical protein
VAVDTDGANIAVRTRFFTEYTMNTVRDVGKVFIGSLELDIADRRDLDKECRRIVRAAKQGKRKKTS